MPRPHALDGSSSSHAARALRRWMTTSCVFLRALATRAPPLLVPLVLVRRRILGPPAPARRWAPRPPVAPTCAAALTLASWHLALRTTRRCTGWACAPAMQRASTPLAAAAAGVPRTEPAGADPFLRSLYRVPTSTTLVAMDAAKGLRCMGSGPCAGTVLLAVFSLRPRSSLRLAKGRHHSDGLLFAPLIFADEVTLLFDWCCCQWCCCRQTNAAPALGERGSSAGSAASGGVGRRARAP